MDVGALTASVAGGLAGGVVASGVVWLFDDSLLALFGEFAGGPGVGRGAGVLLALGVLLAVPFGAFVAGSIDGFVAQVMALSRRSTAVQRVLVPLLRRSALAVTTYSLGQVYGLVVGLVLVVFVLPLAAAPLGAALPFPFLTVTALVGVAAWVVYGAVLGLVYGLVLEV